MNILITGGNGYIGNTLYRELKSLYDVKKIKRDDVILTDSSQVNKVFDKVYYDVVIHCAVSGGSRLKEDTICDMNSNLQMFYNLLSCRNKFGKLIHFGSGAEITQPESPYGLSKRIISKSISDIDNFYNIRIFAVFDENETDTRFIKSNIKRYINKEQLIIHKNKYMDFFYMNDLVKMIKYYINNQSPPKFIDCTYNNSSCLIDIAKKINNLDTYKCNIKIIDESGLDVPYIGNYTPIEDYLGLDIGIINTYKNLLNLK